MAKAKVNDLVGVGRRKTAVSAVRLRKGKGKIDINGRKLEEYFLTQIQQEIVLSPIVKAELENKHDLIVRIKGGGVEAQAIATRLGIARALVKENEALRGEFKDLGYLTRDPRKKERKKYGLAGARKSYQFSKR